MNAIRPTTQPGQTIPQVRATIIRHVETCAKHGGGGVSWGAIYWALGLSGHARTPQDCAKILDGLVIAGRLREDRSHYFPVA